MVATLHVCFLGRRIIESRVVSPSEGRLQHFWNNFFEHHFNHLKMSEHVFFLINICPWNCNSLTYVSLKDGKRLFCPRMCKNVDILVLSLVLSMKSNIVTNVASGDWNVKRKDCILGSWLDRTNLSSKFRWTNLWFL